MIDLSRNAKVSWDHLFLLSTVGILFAGWFAFFAPKPAAKRTVAKPPDAVELRRSAEDTQSKAAAAALRVQERTWDESAETLGSLVLDRLTRLTASKGIQVADFRTGRILSAANLWEVTFTAVLEGSFPQVMALVRQLESHPSKVALSQLKVVAKGSGDAVTATIGLAGFLRKEED